MNAVQEKKRGKKLIVFTILLIVVVFSIVIMVINSKKPGRISMQEWDIKVKGSAFVKTNEALIEQMALNWLPNDYFWPTLFLDNMPNFQIGMLEVSRYNLRVMRDNLTRMRTTDKLDASVEAAFTALSNDPYKWWFPSAESKWKLANNKLAEYFDALKRGDAHFYPRADNLADLLNQYVSLMGGVNTRLINAPRDLNKVLPMDESPGVIPESNRLVDSDISWNVIDDNFYYAQGVAYAIFESLRAIRLDFQDVLIDKNSIQLLDKILEDLNRCDFEPFVVFNGDPESIFANHSLNLSGVFNDARQKLNSLITALRQG